MLAAPMHRHEREEAYSYVLEGRVGVIFDGIELYANATVRDLVRKPRGEWHAFWTAGDGALRIIDLSRSGRLEELLRLMGSTDVSSDLLDDVEDSYGCAVDENRNAVLVGTALTRDGGTMACSFSGRAPICRSQNPFRNLLGPQAPLLPCRATDVGSQSRG